MNFIFWVPNGFLLKKMTMLVTEIHRSKCAETVKVNPMLSERQVSDQVLLTFLIESSFPL